MSVPPNAALSAVKMLSEADLAKGSRVIMEKPFGTDLETAIALNDALHKVFAEDQIFRIDHFLGKEPAQNILAFRFANGLFEPIWSRNFIDHVQIDVPETLDLGKRIGFYEQTGAYRDMVVTHLFQILGFMAMEPPTSLAPGPISEEKNKVFRSLTPIDPAHVVRGQFIGYKKEEGVDPESDTETFIALKCFIDNWRWAGVPFYLRTGKRMAEGQRIISIAFREPPKSMFPHDSGIGSARAGSSHLRSRRPVQGVAVLLWQEAGSGHAAQQAEPAIRDARDRPGRRRARGLRAPHPRRHARRSYPLLLGRRHRAAVGGVDAASSIRRRRSKIYAPGSWGPQSIYQLIAPLRVAIAVRARLARPQSRA
jgi:glucose-6-phosphate 1-dehydrogenase